MLLDRLRRPSFATRPPLRTIASRVATLVGVFFAIRVWLALTMDGGNPADAAIYYHLDLADPYGGWVVGGPTSFQYAPVFAQVIAVLRVLPFEVFVALWRAVALACIVWLAGPFTLLVLLWGPALSEVNAGNVNIFIAAAIAAGFRHPGSWAFVLLTKITPGVGLLWFAVRREWPALRRVALVTGAVVGVSFVLAPGLWASWLQLLVGHVGDAVPTFPYYIPLVARLPIAVLLVVVGARLSWPATVAIGATIAAPILYFPTQSILLGALPAVRATAGRWSDRAARWLEARKAATPIGAAAGSATVDRARADQRIETVAEADAART